MTTNLTEIRSKLFKLVSSDDNRVFVVVASIIITMIIFLIIQSLISRSANLDQKEKNPNLVEFIRINQDDNLQAVSYTHLTLPTTYHV